MDGSGWFPATRQERGRFGLLHGGQALEHIAQIFPGLDAAPPTTHDHRVDDRAAPARFRVPDEQPVLLAEGGRLDCVVEPIFVSGARSTSG